MYRFLKKYKKYIVALGLFFAFCVSVCFIPIDATRFIPVIEKQVLKEYGVNIHIEKLIFRFGPSLKIKAPNMHVMYEDGQKFAQFNNVKFFVPWSTLFKEDVVVVVVLEFATSVLEVLLVVFLLSVLVLVIFLFLLN